MKLRKSVLALAVAGFASGAAHADLWSGGFNTDNGANIHDGAVGLPNLFQGFDIDSQGSSAFFCASPAGCAGGAVAFGTQINPTATNIQAGDVIQTVFQGIVDGLNNAVITPLLSNPNNPITPAAGGYQLTLAATFTEVVTFAVPGLATLQPLDGGRVSVFYDDSSLSGTFITDTAGILAGTGFTDGMVILDGKLAGTLSTLFTTDGITASGSVNLRGPLTVAQQGVVDPANSGADVVGFIPDAPDAFSAQTTLQFGPPEGTGFQTNSFFDNANGWTTVAAIAARTVRTDGNVNLQIPEPATLALVGLGLAGLGMSLRRRAA